MTDRSGPLGGESRRLTPCPNVPARMSCNVRSASITHANGLRGAPHYPFPQAVIIEQPSFGDRNHDMNTIQEAPYVSMFLFRGGSRGLDSPATDDSRHEPCTLFFHGTMGLGGVCRKVDKHKEEVFLVNDPRRSRGLRETIASHRHLSGRLTKPSRRFALHAHWAFRNHQPTGLT